MTKLSLSVTSNTDQGLMIGSGYSRNVVNFKLDQKLAKHLHRQFLPNAAILHADGGEAQQWLAEHNEALAGMKPVNGQPSAYVCQNFTCQAPVTTVEELERLMSQAN